MELSAKVEYALLALLELADYFPKGEPVQIRQIAERQDIPDRYLEQVFSALRKAGIIISQRGNKGGYLLAREPWQITILDIFHGLEDSHQSRVDQETNSLCRSIVRDIWKEAQQNAKQVLQSYTLRDLCQNREVRQQLNTMYFI
jgi:Rrf2 family transcriptional regulator, cysteine metabolism repressor